jgi:hypothetical protein
MASVEDSKAALSAADRLSPPPELKLVLVGPLLLLLLLLLPLLLLGTGG